MLDAPQDRDRARVRKAPPPSPTVSLWQSYGSLKITSKRAETLRRDGISIKGLILADGMHFTRARGSLKLPSPTKSLGDISGREFSSTKTASGPREYPRIDLVAIRKGMGSRAESDFIDRLNNKHITRTRSRQ